MSKFSERITEIMERKNLTQKQLAQMAHVTESAMSYYVKGDRTPRIDVLKRLSNALAVSTDYLLGENISYPEVVSELQYLQGFLEMLNNDQLYKTETLLRIVFEDLFHEYDHSSSGNRIQPVDIRYMYRDGAYDPEMSPFIKLYSDIISVDESGITFNDGSKIDFAECAANSNRENSKCVGARDIDSDPPYFDFTTNKTITRVVFCSNNSFFFKKQKNSQDFIRLQLEINRLGYRTLDLT